MWVDYRGSLSTVYNDGEISHFLRVNLVEVQIITLNLMYVFVPTSCDDHVVWHHVMIHSHRPVPIPISNGSVDESDINLMMPSPYSVL